MRFRHATVFVGFGIAAFLVSTAIASQLSPRNKQRDFIVGSDSSYGTQTCLETRTDCGRIVADAWCESKGFKASLAYRKLDADEVTGSTGTSGKPADAFLISCRD